MARSKADKAADKAYWDEFVREQKEKVRAFDENVSQWSVITKAILKQIPHDERLRKNLRYYLDTPLSQEMAELAILEIAGENPVVEKLTKKFSERLMKTLGEKPYSEEHLHDLYFAEKDNEIGTLSEKYRWARDLKILALAAELCEEQDLHKFMQKKEHSTQNGVRIFLDVEDEELTKSLLSPGTWNMRRQIKDRVYEIDVKGRKFILKEQKTNRHLHTMKGGHRHTRGAPKEYSVAKKLHDEYSTKEDRVSVTWENPLGYVVFPDGYQFCLFEKIDFEKNSKKKLPVEILNHPEQFQQEYEEVKELAQKYLEHDFLRKASSKYSKEHHNIVRRIFNSFQTVDFSFEVFARVKSDLMHHRAGYMTQMQMEKSGYHRNDHEDYLCGVTTEPRVELTRCEIDLEYVEKYSMYPDGRRPIFDEAVMTKDQWLYNARHGSYSPAYAAMYLACMKRLGEDWLGGIHK